MCNLFFIIILVYDEKIHSVGGTVGTSELENLLSDFALPLVLVPELGSSLYLSHKLLNCHSVRSAGQMFPYFSY
jgi:hypothetical protein